MIGYVTLGTNDLERAAKFYDALLAEFGGRRIMEYDRGSARPTKHRPDRAARDSTPATSAIRTATS